jgi:hypothetical protein
MAKAKLTDVLVSAMKTQSTDPAQWVVARVDTMLEETQRPRYDPGWFHPSDLYKKCDAELAFSFLGVEKQGHHSARQQRVFDFGSSRDADWKDYVGRSKLSVHVDDYLPGPCPTCGSKWEQPGGMVTHAARHICLPDFRIRGEYDDKVVNPEDGEIVILEFKTKTAELWKAMKAPDPDHVIQVQPYMVAEQVYHSVIIYECKGCQDVKAYTVGFDLVLWNTITERLLGILDTVALGYDAQRTPRSKEAECPFFHMCSRANFPELVATYKEQHLGR